MGEKMIGSQFFSSDRNRFPIQTAVLAAMFLVRFSYELVGQPVYVMATYALSYIFFLTIPVEERHLYHLTRPSKKIVKTTIIVALVVMLLNIVVTHFCFGDAIRNVIEETPIKTVLSSVTFFFLAPMVIIVYSFFLAGGLPEEFLFRGFFWGYLRKFQISELSILCIQAIPFWAAHYYYASTPGIWIRVLISGLLFGVVAWKTRSIFSSALVHACWNSADVFFVRY
jgi:membrane protease YdiL (CAAX protease family)